MRVPVRRSGGDSAIDIVVLMLIRYGVGLGGCHWTIPVFGIPDPTYPLSFLRCISHMGLVALVSSNSIGISSGTSRHGHCVRVK